MAGSFGLEAEHYDISMRIGELGVLPKMRAAAPDTLLAACGTSCRHQIAEGAGREARHIVRILDEASVRNGPSLRSRGGNQASVGDTHGMRPNSIPSSASSRDSSGVASP